MKWLRSFHCERRNERKTHSVKQNSSTNSKTTAISEILTIPNGKFEIEWLITVGRPNMLASKIVTFFHEWKNMPQSQAKHYAAYLTEDDRNRQLKKRKRKNETKKLHTLRAIQSLRPRISLLKQELNSAIFSPIS